MAVTGKDTGVATRHNGVQVRMRRRVSGSRRCVFLMQDGYH